MWYKNWQAATMAQPTKKMPSVNIITPFLFKCTLHEKQ